MAARILHQSQLSKSAPRDFSPKRNSFFRLAVAKSCPWLLFLAVCGLFTVPAKADDQSGFSVRCFAFKGAKIVKAPGQVVDVGHVIVRDGRILAVGPHVEIPVDADLIEAPGLTIYPGFIDAAATTFLSDEKPTPIEATAVDVSRYALAGMRPDDHSGLTPEYQAAEHLKLAPADLDKYRQAGFVAVNVMPSGRFASGQGCVIHLASAPPRNVTLSATSFATFQIFARERELQGGRYEYPSTKMGVFAHLRQTFLDSDRHLNHSKLFAEGAAGVERPAVDPVWDTFAAIRSGQIRTSFIASDRDDLDRALSLAAEHQLRITVWGGNEAYKIADRLKKTDTNVILHVDFGDEPKLEPAKPTDPAYPEIPPPKRVAEYKVAQWKERIAGLAALKKADVRFAISSKDGKAPADLLKSMRVAIANGLDRDAALAALTSDAAKILSLDSELGMIEAGRPAYFVAMTGPFDHEHSKVRYAVIQNHRYEYNKDAKPVDTSKSGDQPPLQVAGTWNLEIESAEGKVTGELELTQADRTLTGRFQSSKGDGRLTSGKVTKDGLEFVVGIGAGDSTISLKFDTVGWTYVPATPNPPPEKVESPNSEAKSKDAAAPNELRGNLTSPFGAPTKWSAKRVEPKSTSTAAVQLGGIEVDASSAPAATPTQPASALSPANAETAGPQPIEHPVEFPEDRRARPIVTGGNVLVKNGTVLTATGATLRKTSILVRSGTIVAIGADLTADEGTTVIDASDRFVMPGIIDTHSHIMISNGINEMSASIVCEVRVKDVVSSTDASEYRALAGGVTTARLLHGSANCIGGQDAVVQLRHGLSASDHLLPGAHTGVKFALGENVKSFYNRFPNTRLGVEATLNRAFMEALDYRNTWRLYEQSKQQLAAGGDKLLPPRRDLRLEALADIIDHQKFIHSHCYRADEILMLLRVAESHGIRVWSLQHVLEGYKVASEIVKHGASCSTFADWWGYKVEAYDAVPHNAALLHQAGANAVIKSDDWELIRHLYLEAAKTVRYGNMPPDVAIQTITLNPANELGIADRLGSIEVGKQADLAIFSGHPLNALSRCEQTLIAGEVYFTRAKQPTAMSEQAAASSSKPPELSLPRAGQRIERVDLDAANDAHYAIVGATIHPIDADDIPAGIVLIRDGKIEAVGKGVAIPDGLRKVQGEGLHLYPGMIDAGASVGLIEIAQVRPTSDLGEIGEFQADMRAGIAVNPDSELIPVARAGGVTASLVMPSGGGDMTSHYRAHGPIISGQGSVIQFAGWTMPEMVINMEVGLQLLWPNGGSRKTQIDDLKQHFREARVYDKARGVPINGRTDVLIDPRYEAMRPYLRGDRPVLIEAETKQEIVEALQFAEQEKLKVVLCGVTDGWKVADKIKAANISVIVGPVMRKPIEEYDPFDAPYANAGRLYEAGIKMGFRSDSASNSRNLPFEAAMAVAYGLPEKEALRGVTLSTAEILGLSEQMGSLTPGKWANAVLADGSLLQQTTQIKGIFIQGKPFQPESRQTRFYEKYLTRMKAVGVKPRINLFGEAGEVK